MNDDLNLELRTAVLKVALDLEEKVNDLLAAYLNIEIEGTKALSDKSGGLTFRNKIDLLYDIEVLNKEEYSHLLLAMEFRNKFLHITGCNSFTKAVELLSADKGKRLLGFYEFDPILPLENQYELSFQKLHLRIINIVLQKYEAKRAAKLEKANSLMEISRKPYDVVQEMVSILSEILVECEGAYNEIKETAAVKQKICDLIATRMKLLRESDQFKDLLSSDSFFARVTKLLGK